MPGTGLEIEALRCVLRRHSLSSTFLLHDVGELVGEQLLAACAVERYIGSEEDLSIAGERFGIHRASQCFRPAALVNDHLRRRRAHGVTNRLPHLLRNGNAPRATRGSGLRLRSPRRPGVRHRRPETGWRGGAHAADVITGTTLNAGGARRYERRPGSKGCPRTSIAPARCDCRAPRRSGGGGPLGQWC